MEDLKTPTNDEFVAWMQSRPRKESYSYLSMSNCLKMRFLKEEHGFTGGDLYASYNTMAFADKRLEDILCASTTVGEVLDALAVRAEPVPT